MSECAWVGRTYDSIHGYFFVLVLAGVRGGNFWLNLIAAALGTAAYASLCGTLGTYVLR